MKQAPHTIVEFDSHGQRHEYEPLAADVPPIALAGEPRQFHEAAVSLVRDMMNAMQNEHFWSDVPELHPRVNALLCSHAPAVPGGWREVLDRAMDSIGAGDHPDCKMASYEAGIVRPYVDFIHDELESLESAAPALSTQTTCEPVAWMYVSSRGTDVTIKRFDKVIRDMCPTDLVETPLFADPTPSASSVPDGYALVPVRMTASMINAWSGGATVSSDEVAYRTAFQTAWKHVLDAAPPANTKTDWLPTAEFESRLAANPAPSVLTDIEQYRMQMAGISTAALGYWKEGDEVHPDYDTLELRDVAKLYAKYAANAQAPSVLTDEQLDRLIVSACRTNPTVGNLSYWLTLDEVRALLQANGATHD